MKYKSVSCLVILFITLTFIFGCKKDNSKKDYYSGNYSFSTISTGNPDSVILYDGSISYDETSKVLTINYFKEIYNPGYPYTITPIVDDNGVLSYPDLTKPELGYFFNGNIDFDGNINFKMGLRITHQGQTIESSRTVTGKKK
ncbi:MAG: hypothetical protein WCI71_10135 [Bacteroidota bacterium]